MALAFNRNAVVETKQFMIAKRSDETRLFLHELDQLHDPSAIVLDLGAGIGTLSYDKCRSRIIAVDINASMHLPPAVKARFIIADASVLPFASQVFDLVIANFSFEHFAAPDIVLSEIQRILKPNSLLYLSIPNAASWEDRLFRLLGGGKDHVQSYCFHSLIRLIYLNTSLKLVAFADWPPGFTYLTHDLGGSLFRRIIVHSLKILRPLMQKYTRKDSGFIFLLEKKAHPGFRSITHTCAYCGSGATIGVPLPRDWQCPKCKEINSIL